MDDILGQIDDVIDNWNGSDDSMRWRPEPDGVLADEVVSIPSWAEVEAGAPYRMTRVVAAGVAWRGRRWHERWRAMTRSVAEAQTSMGSFAVADWETWTVPADMGVRAEWAALMQANEAAQALYPRLVCVETETEGL